MIHSRQVMSCSSSRLTPPRRTSSESSARTKNAPDGVAELFAVAGRLCLMLGRRSTADHPVSECGCRQIQRKPHHELRDAQPENIVLVVQVALHDQSSTKDTGEEPRNSAVNRVAARHIAPRHSLTEQRSENHTGERPAHEN